MFLKQQITTGVGGGGGSGGSVKKIEESLIMAQWTIYPLGAILYIICKHHSTYTTTTHWIIHTTHTQSQQLNKIVNLTMCWLKMHATHTHTHKVYSPPHPHYTLSHTQGILQSNAVFHAYMHEQAACSTYQISKQIPVALLTKLSFVLNLHFSSSHALTHILVVEVSSMLNKLRHHETTSNSVNLRGWIQAGCCFSGDLSYQVSELQTSREPFSLSLR